jgi:hypothetical protein
VSTPEPKPDPFVPKTIVVNKELAARGQLATAIALWFNYADPVSIHTLAAAAQGILEGVAGSKHELPHMRKWIRKFPKSVQKKLRDPQNFFKHAWTDPKDLKVYQPIIGDFILMDAVLLHQDLYGLTPGIRAFTIRLGFEHPGVLAPHELSEKVTQGIRVGDLGGLDRPTFLNVVLARLAAVQGPMRIG